MSFTTGLFHGVMPSHEQSIGLSPFVFEKDLNIEFRRTLQHLQPFDIDTNCNVASMMTAPRAGDRADSSESQLDTSPRLDDAYRSTPTSPGNSSLNDSTSSSSPPMLSSDSSSPTTTSSGSSCSSPLPCTSSSPPSTPNATPNYHQCSKCGESFRLKGDLTKHWFRLHEKRFSCAECGKPFNLKADLKRHTKSRHPGQLGKDQVPCEYAGCREMFTRRDNMFALKALRARYSR